MKPSEFSIGHRGATLMFPEHTERSWRAAARMGAGIIECDVTFTKDEELICRHSQCDLHTTTDIVLRPELNAKCTTPWAPGVKAAKCCTSDFTLAEIKTLCAKMDASNGAALTADKYVFGSTADWRTGKLAFRLRMSS
jgi:glycerophosphoryl diester phosphodiesterase